MEYGLSSIHPYIVVNFEMYMNRYTLLYMKWDAYKYRYTYTVNWNSTVEI